MKEYVASLELCQELYALSGWDETGGGYVPEYDPDEPPVAFIPENKLAYTHECQDYYYVTKESDVYQVVYIPAYDAGYLLRKLPKQYLIFQSSFTLYRAAKFAYDGELDETIIKPFSWEGFKEPEDALCKLAIELFKQGILKKEANQ